MSGTDIASGAISYACPTQCPVLTQRMGLLRHRCDLHAAQRVDARAHAGHHRAAALPLLAQAHAALRRGSSPLPLATHSLDLIELL
eukprot:3364812-Rhodomonas_salina.3